MNAPQKRQSPQDGGLRRRSGKQQRAQQRRDRRRFQGIAARRGAAPPAPAWERPRQADALHDLEVAFRGTSRTFVVVLVVLDRRREWGRFPGIQAAQDVAAKLRRHGMDARVEVAP